MAESKKENSLNVYKNIIGSTKETIEAIQKYLEENSKIKNNVEVNNKEKEENALDSINKIIQSTTDSQIASDIQKIINNL